ncbi:hypothetical protein [Nocardia sp. NPDC051981]|uniref:hypothetical protein n=1 Tax=Nocardia sp. NPDC051981 TaxID=3155417 RepID=UPI003411FF2E
MRKFQIFLGPRFLGQPTPIGSAGQDRAPSSSSLPQVSTEHDAPDRGCPAGRDIPSSEQAAVRGDLSEFVLIVLRQHLHRPQTRADRHPGLPAARARSSDELKSLLAKEFRISREIADSYLRADTVTGCWQAETDPAAWRERRW